MKKRYMSVVVGSALLVSPLSWSRAEQKEDYESAKSGSGIRFLESGGNGNVQDGSSVVDGRVGAGVSQVKYSEVAAQEKNSEAVPAPKAGQENAKKESSKQVKVLKAAGIGVAVGVVSGAVIGGTVGAIIGAPIPMAGSLAIGIVAASIGALVGGVVGGMAGGVSAAVSN